LFLYGFLFIFIDLGWIVVDVVRFSLVVVDLGQSLLQSSGNLRQLGPSGIVERRPPQDASDAVDVDDNDDNDDDDGDNDDLASDVAHNDLFSVTPPRTFAPSRASGGGCPKATYD